MLDLKTKEWLIVKRVAENIENTDLKNQVFFSTHFEQSKNFDNLFNDLADFPLLFMYKLMYPKLVETW